MNLSSKRRPYDGRSTDSDWLGPDDYSVSFAVHSEDITSYDWLDGVSFFRVIAGMKIEGLANLNASAVARRLGQIENQAGVNHPS